MVLPDFYKGYHKEGAAMRKKPRVKSTKQGQKEKLSNTPKPTPKPKFKGNTDALGNRTNLKAKEAAYKAMGGVAKYYEGGGEVLTGRQHNLPDHLKNKIIAAKKKKMT